MFFTPRGMSIPHPCGWHLAWAWWTGFPSHCIFPLILQAVGYSLYSWLPLLGHPRWHVLSSLAILFFPLFLFSLLHKTTTRFRTGEFCSRMERRRRNFHSKLLSRFGHFFSYPLSVGPVYLQNLRTFRYCVPSSFYTFKKLFEHDCINSGTFHSVFYHINGHVLLASLGLLAEFATRASSISLTLLTFLVDLQVAHQFLHIWMDMREIAPTNKATGWDVRT